MKRPKKKRSKKILKKHPAGGKGLQAPGQQGSIVSPPTAGPGTAASVSATGGGTVVGA